MVLTTKLGELSLQPFCVTATEYVPVMLVVYVGPVEPSCQRYVPPVGLADNVTEQLLEL